MASITGKIEFYTSPESMTARDLRITVEQDFDIVRGFEGLELQKYGEADICIYAGEMLLWNGCPSEVSGWLKPLVQSKIENADWGIASENIREEFESEEEDRDFARIHSAGRV